MKNLDFLHRTWAEIDIDALIHNFEIIKAESGGAKIMSVVKADAYGHSAKLIAPALEKCGTDYFAVSNIDEALELRACGIKKPILILGYTPSGCAKILSDNGIIQCVYSSEYAAELSDSAVKSGVTVKIHLKLDTGMGRIGFNCRVNSLPGIDDAIEAARLPGFELCGTFTHFAVSDRSAEEEDGFTDEQYRRFRAAADRISAAGLNPGMCHCCNSAASCLDAEKHNDCCRPGITLYGLTPSPSLHLKEDFIPVMTVKSVVSMVKYISRGDTVSYGRTFTADRKMKIATVTAGYADGYPRLLSGRGQVIVNGKRADIIGRVCMDQMMIDVSNIENVKQGDEVILLGRELSATELAEKCGTVNYEIVCGISKRVPRIIKQNAD